MLLGADELEAALCLQRAQHETRAAADFSTRGRAGCCRYLRNMRTMMRLRERNQKLFASSSDQPRERFGRIGLFRLRQRRRKAFDAGNFLHGWLRLAHRTP